MAHVIKKKIPDIIREEAWVTFLQLIKVSDSTKILRKRLERFLTPTEFVLLEKRLAITALLRHGISYKKIGRIIDVSPHTISFVKYNLVRNPLKGLRASVRKQYDFSVEGQTRHSHTTISTVLGEARRQQRLRRR